MTVSTVTLNPGTVTVPGLGANAETPLMRDLIQRAARDDYDQWLSDAMTTGGCTHPVRLQGEIAHVAPTGELLDVRQTTDHPDGILYTSCGNRREAVCPACSQIYRRDAYHLIRSGLAGGKGVPNTVSQHPAVFATLTAPSYGLVHTRRTAKSGKQIPCRPRRNREYCRHGREISCARIHREDERCLGRPLCPDCYDYAGAVIWNAHAPELWRRTMIALRRVLDRRAKQLGVKVVVRYAKVAEFQARGLVHFHALIRLDGHDPDNAIIPPPLEITADDLTDALQQAIHNTWFATLDHPRKPGGWDITWGDQLDVRHVQLSGDGEITDGHVASYLAKYATKSTEAVGAVSRRITENNLDIYAPPHTHFGRLIRAAWTLGDHPHEDFKALRRWAHMLGFRGHFTTKSRRYSTTFKVLRAARQTWRRRQHRTAETLDDADTTLIVGLLSYAGTGWRTQADALLALTAAAKAREYAQTAREEIDENHEKR
ncbi:replication initiator [Nonomuraea sp. SYSU D8015]|uniref:replication initiator n=1 Tax=Nonomuraea sp. SYSU D8015 TaxID=2593644 RepID=UPI00166147B9|nr:replication initiator [Nonomuraea sp. SYSU D8015]